MKVFKKNQLALLVISLMLITAGYLNYTATYGVEAEEVSSEVEDNIDLASIGDAELVNANVTEENEIVQETEEEIEETEETASETASSSSSDYFTTSKLERNVMYSQMIERYQEILESSNSYSEQKTVAQEEINKINETQNAIMITENLLTAKGFEENVIFVNGDSVSVIIGAEELSQDEIAQIQNIVSREMSADVENIHISLKWQKNIDKPFFIFNNII